MGWEMIYKKTHSHISKKQTEIGLADWRRRSYILLNWLQKYNSKKDLKILDCGCGIGISGQILKEEGYFNVIGVDNDESDLKFASKIYSVRKMDCQNLKFSPESFDVVLALNVIEHLENPRKFLIEVKRVLKKEGLFILSLPNTTFLRKLVRRTIAIPEHINYWDYKSFKKFLETGSFKILEIKPVSRFPFIFLCNTIMVIAKDKFK